MTHSLRSGGPALIAMVLVTWALFVPAAAAAEDAKIQDALKARLTEGQAGLTQATGPPEVEAAQPKLSAKEVEALRVVVEATGPEAAWIVEDAVRQLGGRVELRVREKVQAELPSAAIGTLSKRSEVSFIRLPFTPRFHQGAIVTEGAEIIGALAWHEGGFKGQGVKVGVLDSGFLAYERLEGRELPPAERLVTRSFRADGDLECRDCDQVSQVHGLAVAEIVYDIAPEATLYLANFSTDVEMEAAVHWMIEERVDVINTSFGFLTTGCPYEGTGFLDPVFEEARQGGILWAASAGNEARRHWAGGFSDPDGDNWINFFEDDESQTLVNVESGERVVAILWWDDPCRRAPHDYDLVLVDEAGNELARSSRAGPRASWPLELLAVEISESGTYELKLEAVNGSRENRFSLLLLDHIPQYVVPEGSAGLTEPEMSRFVVSVGATDLDSRLEPFSSRGPTPDGRIKPDLVAPDRVSTRTFRQFGGTSASSPHAAGAAALVKSAFPSFGPDQIQAFLSERAEDFGPPGSDGQYGAGLLFLSPPPERQGPPRAPSSLTAVAAGPHRIELSWQDNSEDESGFLIERRLEAEEAFSELAQVEADVTRYADQSVQAGMSYCYRVRALGAQGAGEPSDVACAATPVPNRPPIADAGADQTVLTGMRVLLDGRGSSDPDGDPLSFRWAFVGKPQTSAAELGDPTDAVTSFVPDFPGTYVVELTVTDPLGAVASDWVRVEVHSPTGVLVVLKFVELAFLDPEAWERTLQGACVVYRNVGEGAARLRVTPVEGSLREYEIPAGSAVIVCGEVAHIDARPPPPLQGSTGAEATGEASSASDRLSPTPV